jgi:hypothetical protein
LGFLGDLGHALGGVGHTLGDAADVVGKGLGNAIDGADNQLFVAKNFAVRPRVLSGDNDPITIPTLLHPVADYPF